MPLLTGVKILYCIESKFHRRAPFLTGEKNVLHRIQVVLKDTTSHRGEGFVLQGVLTLGDTEGTLQQLHVGTGHILNEVDAHVGRRWLPP
jgi:hypothetical protein